MKTTHLLFSSLLASTAWADSAKPLVFFANINDTLVPLYRKTLFSKVSAFVPGDVATASEFLFQNDIVIDADNTLALERTKNLDFFNVGLAAHQTKLKLDEHNKVLNSNYYICSKVFNFTVISNKIVSPFCSDVELYFLPLDKNTGTAVVESQNPETSLKESSKNMVSSPVSKNVPCVFFVLIAGKMFPLGQRTYSRPDGNFSALCFGNLCSTAVSFVMEGDYAISMNTNNDGYVGFKDNLLTFDRSINPVALRLDEHRKLLNANFYSCMDPQGSHIMSTVRLVPSCVDVSIFLLHQ